MFVRAEVIRREAQGVDHPNRGETLVKLGRAAKADADAAAAVEALEEAVRIFRVSRRAVDEREAEEELAALREGRG